MKKGFERGSRLSERLSVFSNYIKAYKSNGYYPYFKEIAATSGTEVEVGGNRLIMVNSNDYLGLTHDRYVIDKTLEAIKSYGTGMGGSRFLCGNLKLHSELERRLAEFVGKHHALVLPTGFSTNLGVISSMLNPGDIILFDRVNHASIYDACRMTKARLVPFKHNDAVDAEQKLNKIVTSDEEGIILLITEGVFSMSGTIADLPSFVALKEKFPHLYIYLDDAHGLGTMGDGGRGVAQFYNKQDDVDFIMGTFSKSFASIGGFVACDDEGIAEYLRHKSRTMIFSAALPPGNVATVLACLDVIEEQPERVERLWSNIERVMDGYRSIGLQVAKARSPIIPVNIGDEELALKVSYDLFENDIFALPVVFPAVARKNAIIRTSFMSSHTDEQLDSFVDTLAKILKRYNLPAISENE